MIELRNNPIRLVKKLITNPFVIVPRLHNFKLARLIPDDIYLRGMYRGVYGRKLNLSKPETFNEKLQWLKLNDRNPRYTVMVDKCAAKQWVSETIGDQYVAKTYAKWEDVDEIEIDGLPRRFVLKTNHDSGGIAICDDRESFDLGEARRKLRRHMKRNFYWVSREWPYKSVTPCVFAEEYLDPGRDGDLVDYKFMCFGGKVECLFVCTGRAAGDLRVDFFSPEWEHLPFTRHYKNADGQIDCPASLREMIDLAEALSSGIPFVRVDFYEIEERPIFSEMTFYPGAGFEKFDPEIWDERLGSLIDLSLVNVSPRAQGGA